MDPPSDGMIGSLDLGWIIGRQPELAAGNELEILLVQVSRCYLISTGQLLYQAFGKTIDHLRFTGRNEPCARQAGICAMSTSPSFMAADC